MEALTKFTHCNSPLSPTLHHHRPSISAQFYFQLLPSSSSSSPFKIKSSRIKASYSKFPLQNPKIPKFHPFETLIPSNSFVRTALVAAVTATAVFFAGFNRRLALAAPQPTVESSSSTIVESNSNFSEIESNSNFNEVESNSNFGEVESLRNLMESKLNERKISEVIEILEKLIRIQPEEVEWRLMKSYMHFYSDDVKSAKLGFKEIIKNDPLRVEAYHGLLMVASQSTSITELGEIANMIEDAMELAKDENFRDFKLLYAQIQVIAGDYKESLRSYNELVYENPEDFRPYLCKGIIHTLLKEKNEADKCFEKYRTLVPKDHENFDEHMLATKVFLQKTENAMKSQLRSRGA